MLIMAMSFGTVNEMRYELKKLLWRRESLILLVILVGYIAFFTARIDRGGTYTDVDTSMQSFELHQTEMIDTVTALRERAESAPTEYIKADYEKAFDCYNVRYEFEPFDTVAVQSGLSLCYLSETNIALLVFVISLVSPVIAREHECGMYQLLYTTKGGRSRLFFQKSAAVFVLVCLISVVFTFSVFICVWQRRGLGFGALSAPVQSMEMLYYCPFELDIIGFLMLLCAVRAMCAMIAVAFVFLLSAMLKNSFAVMGISTCLVAGLYYNPKIFERIGQAFSKLGLLCLLDIQGYLSSYDTINVFGMPLFSFPLSLMFTLALTASLFALGYSIYCRERRSNNAA